MKKNSLKSERCKGFLTFWFQLVFEWLFTFTLFFLHALLGRLTKTLQLSQVWCFNEGLTKFRKQIYWLSFVKANETVDLSWSKSQRMTMKVEPTTLDDFVMDDMMMFLVMLVTCSIMNNQSFTTKLSMVIFF